MPNQKIHLFPSIKDETKKEKEALKKLEQHLQNIQSFAGMYSVDYCEAIIGAVDQALKELKKIKR